MAEARDFDDELRIWEQRQAAAPGQMGFKAACLKKGPRAFKSVRISRYGNPDTGELRHTELSLLKNERLPEGGFDFDSPSETFRLENDEIERLAAFLANPEVAAGTYRLVGGDSPVEALIQAVRDGRVGAEGLIALVEAAESPEALATALGSVAHGVSAAEIAVLSSRRAKVAELQALCADNATTETVMQGAMEDHHWLFGGQYVGVLDRRNLALLDQLDIPLVRADGTVQVVELKGPVIGDLVVEHRNHLIVGRSVHEATSQAMNYLRSLDEQGPAVERALGDIGIMLGTRRVFATVVIGHPGHVEGRSEDEIEETIRTYNSHLSRVEIVTYKGLLDAAARALDFTERA